MHTVAYCYSSRTGVHSAPAALLGATGTGLQRGTRVGALLQTQWSSTFPPLAGALPLGQWPGMARGMQRGGTGRRVPLSSTSTSSGPLAPLQCLCTACPQARVQRLLLLKGAPAACASTRFPLHAPLTILLPLLPCPLARAFLPPGPPPPVHLPISPCTTAPSRSATASKASAATASLWPLTPRCCGTAAAAAEVVVVVVLVPLLRTLLPFSHLPASRLPPRPSSGR